MKRKVYKVVCIKRNMNKQNLHKIINELIEVRGESGLKFSDEVLFIQACSYERGEIANQNRNPFKQEIKESNFKPSYKQLKILKEAGYKDNIINQMSKKEISIAIGDYLKNSKRENI